MKGIIKKFVAVAATVLFWSSQANAVLIEIVPDTVGPIGDGDSFSVEIWAKDLGSDYITAYDILVAYDTSLMNWASVGGAGCELGECDFAAFSDLAVGSDITDAAGLIGWASLSFLFDWEFPSFQDGSDFRLFTIAFVATADFDSTDFSFVWDKFHDVKCLENDPCFPTAVPEPGTLALLGLGLLGMAISRRRLRS